MRMVTTLGLLILIAAGTTLLAPGISSAQDGEEADSALCESTCDCYRDPPPLPPAQGEKGLPDTDPEGKEFSTAVVPGD